MQSTEKKLLDILKQIKDMNKKNEYNSRGLMLERDFAVCFW